MDKHPDSLSRTSAVSSARLMNRPIFPLLMALVLSVGSQVVPAAEAAPAAQAAQAAQAAPAHNPLIWADVPDIVIIRVGKT